MAVFPELRNGWSYAWTVPAGQTPGAAEDSHDVRRQKDRFPQGDMG